MRGFSLVSAIFLLIVLAALGVAMVTISTTQHQSSSLDIEGVRAYQAAKAGIEWGVYQKLPPRNSCATLSTVTIPRFTVIVSCDQGEAGTAVIKAVACNFPVNNSCDQPSNNPDYVKRILEVRL
ncbi:pilus assembly PilX family protein [Oxalicibacterium solurbis]|nr:pilus assembly PilX N-terminal domain-containing protein [Oxalicibacterium solurbis]